MEPQNIPIVGGVGLLHSVKEGKHHYEVGTVFSDNMDQAETFMRQGDQLMKINELGMQDLSPEMFVKLLSKGNIMLRVHHASKEEITTEKTGGFRPVFKENTVLMFSVSTDQDSDQQGEEDLELDSELEPTLVAKMVGTYLEKVIGRGCAHGQTCEKCASTDCPIEDLVMVSEKVEVSCGFKKDKEEKNNLITSLLFQRFLSHSKNNRAILRKTRENITIYYYESDQEDGRPKEFKGVPVVLNFTDTNQYLRCSRTENGGHISVVTCNKEDLNFISKDNEEMLSFVFYMRGERSANHIFESACCEGWCVNATSSNRVDVTDHTKIDSLYFFISSYTSNI